MHSKIDKQTDPDGRVAAPYKSLHPQRDVFLCLKWQDAEGRIICVTGEKKPSINLKKSLLAKAVTDKRQKDYRKDNIISFEWHTWDPRPGIGGADTWQKTQDDAAAGQCVQFGKNNSV